MVFGSDAHAEAITTGSAAIPRASARTMALRLRAVLLSRKSCIAEPIVDRLRGDVPGFLAGHPVRVLAQVMTRFRRRRLRRARPGEGPEPLHLRVLGEGRRRVTGKQLVEPLDGASVVAAARGGERRLHETIFCRERALFGRMSGIPR